MKAAIVTVCALGSVLITLVIFHHVAPCNAIWPDTEGCLIRSIDSAAGPSTPTASTEEGVVTAPAPPEPESPIKGQIVVRSVCSDPDEPSEFQPKSMDVSCNGDTIDGLAWSSWGDDTAEASGRMAVNDCEPDCADGTETVHAVRVQLLALLTCGDEQRYAGMSVTFADTAPPGSDSTVDESNALTC